MYKQHEGYDPHWHCWIMLNSTATNINESSYSSILSSTYWIVKVDFNSANLITSKWSYPNNKWNWGYVYGFGLGFHFCPLFLSYVHSLVVWLFICRNPFLILDLNFLLDAFQILLDISDICSHVLLIFKFLWCLLIIRNFWFEYSQVINNFL